MFSIQNIISFDECLKVRHAPKEYGTFIFDDSTASRTCSLVGTKALPPLKNRTRDNSFWTSISIVNQIINPTSIGKKCLLCSQVWLKVAMSLRERSPLFMSNVVRIFQQNLMPGSPTHTPVDVDHSLTTGLQEKHLVQSALRLTTEPLRTLFPTPG